MFDQIIPVIRFLENLFRSRGIPYLLDYTPSGGHILFQNLLGYRATEELKKEENIPDWTGNILYFPNPSALQPKKIGVVYDFLIHANWKPKQIENILRDMYQNPSFNWTQDFFKYPAEEKANFWAKTYSSVALLKTGRISV